jgi:hypothetical protein
MAMEYQESDECLEDVLVATRMRMVWIERLQMP